MLRKIQQFYINNISVKQESNDEQQLQLVTAALFIEMMLSDGSVSTEEKMSVKKAVNNCFNLPDHEIDLLLKLAQEELEHSTDYYQFTQLINKNFNQSEKIKVIENLWNIAYSDSELDDLEEHMVRKISELLYVPHTQFIKAKLKIQSQIKNHGS